MSIRDVVTGELILPFPSLAGQIIRTPCPGKLELNGHPCGCRGLNPSHYPPDWPSFPKWEAEPLLWEGDDS